MVIELNTESLLRDIRGKSHYEVSVIEDADARYRAEAGTEKTEDIKRCLKEAIGQLARRCRRFLDDDQIFVADNILRELPDSYVFRFLETERRRIPVTEALAAAMHSLVVHYALSKFYSDVSQGELSNKHSMAALEAGNEIDAILYTKQPPI